MTDTERHIYMQDKMFPDWRRYWIYSNGKYKRKYSVNKANKKDETPTP